VLIRRVLSRVYTSATCCAAASCADEQHVAGNKKQVARNMLLVARNMLRWCKRGIFAFTPAQLVARQQVARNKQHVAGNKLLVARNKLQLFWTTCCSGVTALEGGRDSNG